MCLYICDVAFEFSEVDFLLEPISLTLDISICKSPSPRKQWERGEDELTSRRSRLVYGVLLPGGGTRRLLRRRDLLLRS